MKDNRKNLKKGFVCPYTSKEEPEKNHFKGILARKFISVQQAEGTGPLCSSLSKYTLPSTESPWGQRLNYSSLAPNTPNPQREEEGTLIIALWIWDFPLFFFFFFFKSTRTLCSKEITPGSPKWKTNKVTKVKVFSSNASMQTYKTF